jgi:crossover junction endodeoxyribonuclease RusA
MPTFRRPTTSYFASKLPVRFVSARNSRKQGSRLTVARLPQSVKISAGTLISPATTSSDTVDTIVLALPVPPSVNHQYASVNGRRLLSAAVRAYKAQVGQLVWLALSKFPNRSALLSRLQSESLALSIRFYFTSALRRDVDGGLKIAQDALCEGLGINDNRIVETHLYKQVDKANPRIEVLLAATSPMT